MVGSIAEVFPDADYQRCIVHFYRSVLAKVPRQRRKKVAAMLQTIHAQESFEDSEENVLRVPERLESKKLREAAKVICDSSTETHTYSRFPVEHWRW